MAAVQRIFSITVMASIIIFAIIHLGVSIGIIVRYRKYGDIVTPQIGLSAFNLVISFFGLLTGILGFVAAWLSSSRFGKVVCFIAALLGIFTLASLITAIVLNAKSLDHISSHFGGNMIEYQNNAGARNKIDLLQIKYQCCGTNLWIDWANVELNQTTSVMNVTGTTIATTGSSMNMTSTISNVVSTTGSVTTTTSTITTGTATSIGSTTTAAGSTAGIGKRDIAHVSNNLHQQQLFQLTGYSRKKRQIVGTYGGIENLPLTFGVVLPKSCCTSGALLTSNASNAYCISNANNAVNHFNLNGCAKPIDKNASNQFMGFGVINSIMLVLALVAIPILLVEQPETT